MPVPPVSTAPSTMVAPGTSTSTLQSPIPEATKSPASPAPSVSGTFRNGKADGAKANIKLFLAKIYYSADGTNAVFGLDIRTSPRATTTGSGQFNFINVEPGDYVLFVGDPTFSGSVRYSDAKGNDVIIRVRPNQPVILGEVVVAY